MNETELNKIVDAWIIAESAEPGSHDHESNWWAVEQVMNWSLDDQYEHLWRFILVTYKRDLSDKAIAVLAAGPLEDLLAKQDSQFIERVEELARTDRGFNYLLGGVWRSSMTDEIWLRVQTACHHAW